MRIASAGNVGIGTSSPNAGLDVRSNVAFDETASYSQAGGQAYRAIGRSTDDYSWAPLVFPYTPRGTTLPGNYLGGMSYLPASITLYGNDKGDNSATAFNPSSGLVNGTNYTITSVGNTNWTSIGASSATVGIIFTYNNATVTPATGNTGLCKLAPNLAQRITILNPSGNVGIGTSSPGTTLEVYGSITSRPASTQDAIIISGRAGGTSSYGVTLTPATLNSNQTITIPNETGIIVTTATTLSSGTFSMLSALCKSFLFGSF